MKNLKEILGGVASGAGPMSLLGGLAAGAASGEMSNKSQKKQRSSMDEAISAETERHREGYKQRSEHGQY